MIEHLLKDVDDLKAYLTLPDAFFEKDEVDLESLQRLDERVGTRGIVMADTADPICEAAGLFDMATYTILAVTEPTLMHRLLERIAGPVQRQTEAVARAFPGHLWRIYGPEYAVEPYLPPHCFEEYVVRYTRPMVESIQRYGGYARIHCHGRVARVLPKMVAMGASATDPLEPPPQGNVTLSDVRRMYGRDLVLFGNIEISDIENLPPPRFHELALRAVADGTHGEGRGFVLMPTSCPYGRTITPNTMTNYETLVEAVR
jgi:uroporphyrinogen-III decarboxylase